jgi:CRP/FNR family transcriptional regulator, cyclic AMP receptor protein
VLGAIPLFSACSQRELKLVASLTVPSEIMRGKTLTFEGRSAGIAFIVVAGRAEVLIHGQRVASVGPGETVGELSLIDGGSRSATVRALTDMEVLTLDGRSFRKLLTRAPSVERKLLQGMASRLRDVDARAASSP